PPPIQNRKSKIASTAALLSHPCRPAPSVAPKTTAHPAECVCLTSASATSQASITASTAAQPNPPSYPAESALALTATNAANASTTPTSPTYDYLRQYSLRHMQHAIRNMFPRNFPPFLAFYAQY